jgi:isocitrate/isopropylmalate dehydrogenase
MEQNKRSGKEKIDCMISREFQESIYSIEPQAKKGKSSRQKALTKQVNCFIAVKHMNPSKLIETSK